MADGSPQTLQLLIRFTIPFLAVRRVGRRTVFYVRPARALTWRCKSAIRLAARSISQRQGCPPRGRIWRKPAAKPWPDEQKPHIRPFCAGEFA